MVETLNSVIALSAIVTEPAAKNSVESPSEVLLADARYPLSAMQQGMIFNSLYLPQSGVEVEQILCTLSEAIDIDCLIQSWEKLFEHHAVLRTSITGLGSETPMQVVYPTIELPFNQQNWQHLAIPEQTRQLEEFLQRDRQLGFNLLNEREPLTRLTLIQLAENHYRLLWTFHHVLLDGRSIRRLLEEFFSVYGALQRGETPVLKSTRRYRDHIAWLQAQDTQLAKPFWQDLLQGITHPTPLPQCLKAPSASDLASSLGQFGHGQVTLELNPSETLAIAQFAECHQITPNTLVQASWALLLSRHSNCGDVVFGAVRACRRSSVDEADAMVGLLMNSLPVRVTVDLDAPLVPWLQTLRAQHLAVRPYEHTPLPEVQSWSELPRGMALFESLVMFERGDLRGAAGRSIELIEQPSLPLVLIAHWEAQLTLRISYDRMRFDHATAQRLLGQLTTLLNGMVADPTQTLSQVPWVTPIEQQQLLIDWQDTHHPYRAQLLHEPFEAQAKRQPEAVALFCQDAFGPRTMTYDALNRRANQLAHYLQAQGIGAGDVVGIYLDRNVEMVCALLAILKAGAAYVPLEPSFPDQRVEWILRSLSARIVLSEAQYVGKDLALPDLKQWVNLDGLDLSQYSDVNPLPLACPDDTAYMIFTSGSTGTPKGVKVAHRSVMNLIEWVNQKFGVNSDDRLLFVTSICFDLSVYDIFGLLAAGGSIHIASKAEISEPRALIYLLNHGGITFWDSAPPALQRLAPMFDEILPGSLRLVFMSGDWIPIALPKLLQKTFASVNVVSLGGATEASVWSNFFEIGETDPSWSSIPYGKPIQNAQYYILDAQLNPCPIGVTGELYIGGDCLAQGYSDPVKTAVQFIPAPKAITQCDRLYRTGDLARFFPDGNIEFLGRIDHQVKIRGYRIELGEIEAVLAQHPQVETSVAIAHGKIREDRQLVAYVVPHPGIDLTVKELQDFLRKRLPDYMIPAAVLFLAALPITQNGKLDRTALPDPEAPSPSSNTFVVPATGLERKLAELWEQVLGVNPVGRHDSFFELGGHSLMAVKLMARIERTLDAQVPIAALFQAPTVAQMAELLTHNYALTPWNTIEVRAGDRTKPPIFWCQSYAEIKAAFPKDQPFYGLESGFLEIRDPKTHIKTWAKGYIDQIQAIQPEGPYYLGGYCFGGYIALEIAHLLQAQGQEVALLSLVESYGPAIPYYQKNFSFYSSFLVMLSVKRRLQARWQEHQEKPQGDFPAPQSVDDLLPHGLIQAAVRNYDRPTYAGKVALFASNISHLGSSLQPQLGWNKTFTGNAQVWKITGGHYSIFSAPHLQVLSASLRSALASISTNP